MTSYHPAVEHLQESGHISVAQLKPLHEQLVAYRQRPDALKEVLLKHKVVSEEDFQQALASYYNLEFRASLEDVPIDPELSRRIPIRYAKRFNCMPMRQQNEVLEVVTDDPRRLEALEELSREFGCAVQPVLAARQVVLDFINRSYDQATGFSEEAVGDLDAEERIEGISGLEEPEDLLDATDEEPVKRLVNSLLWQAVRDGVSDVHVDPTPKETQIRYRIDGVLHAVTVVPRAAHITVVNRIKVMSRLDIAQKGIPQDGQTMIVIAGKKIDIRVSTVPTVYGEKVVMRLLQRSEKLLSLPELGMSKRLLEPYRKMVHASGGIVLVTGPTGSGKTTTLYASLSEIDHTARNVITIEEPVEYKMPGYSQIEVNPRIGLSFASALRSVLRQDPDVVMVGEMRDTETAQIAIQAALTGHLVFSTVHTNNAPATITRLIDMGIEPFLVSSTIIGVLAQRLVRRICPDCKEAYEPHPEQLRELRIPPKVLEKSGGVLYRGKGCDACRQTGYRGRIGIHELLPMTETVKQVILNTNDSNSIRRQAIKENMITLRRDGIYKVLLGVTTAEEVLAITTEEAAVSLPEPS